MALWPFRRLSGAPACFPTTRPGPALGKISAPHRHHGTVVLDNMLTNTGKARIVSHMTNLAQLLSTVQSSEFALDSSKLRGTATKRADAEGLVKIAKYNRTVGYLASPAVVEELVGAADELAQTRRELPLVATLLSTALRLGIDPETAVQALVANREDGAHIDLANLASLIETAADNLDAAAVARQRLQMPADQDLTLEEVASELGLDLAEIRANVNAGSAAAQYATS